MLKLAVVLGQAMLELLHDFHFDAERVHVRGTITGCVLVGDPGAGSGAAGAAKNLLSNIEGACWWQTLRVLSTDVILCCLGNIVTYGLSKHEVFLQATLLCLQRS